VKNIRPARTNGDSHEGDRFGRWLGTRLYPITLAISKQLAPVYTNRSLLSVVGPDAGGIRDICYLTPHDLPHFQRCLATARPGREVSYALSPSPLASPKPS